MEEVWKDVAGWEGLYQVSNLGRVKSLPRKVPYPRGQGWYSVKGKILKPQVNAKTGYLMVNLKYGGELERKSIHRMVAELFIPNPQRLPEVNHRDGDKTNPHVLNLEWATESDNAIHAYATGLIKIVVGEAVSSAKLTEVQVLQIRELCKQSGARDELIAQSFNVSRKCIAKIRTRETWKHI